MNELVTTAEKIAAKLIERNFVVTPAADRMIDISFAFNSAVGSEITEFEDCGAGGDGGGSGFESGSAGHDFFHGTKIWFRREVISRCEPKSRFGDGLQWSLQTFAVRESVLVAIITEKSLSA